MNGLRQVIHRILTIILLLLSNRALYRFTAIGSETVFYSNKCYMLPGWLLPRSFCYHIWLRKYHIWLRFASSDMNKESGLNPTPSHQISNKMRFRPISFMHNMDVVGSKRFSWWSEATEKVRLDYLAACSLCYLGAPYLIPLTHWSGRMVLSTSTHDSGLRGQTDPTVLLTQLSHGLMYEQEWIAAGMWENFHRVSAYSWSRGIMNTIKWV